MNSDTAILVENISKVYHVGALDVQRTRIAAIRHSLTSPVRRLRTSIQGKSAFAGDNELWALQDVSFEVKRGEIVGIIGPNGSGKSTLLKILSQITYPTKGSAKIAGKVGSLLEVGTGFHPELTGRENIFMNASILGVTRGEVMEVFDEIIEFSGVGNFLDTPVKRYSSGMKVRLAFSVAVFLQPEIVLIDEVLSVGDAGFRKSSLDKISKLATDGRTVLLVSHNLQSIQNLCSRVIYLHDGVLKMDGDVNDVVEMYLNEALPETAMQGYIDLSDAERGKNVLTDEFRFSSIELVDDDGEAIPAFNYGQPVRLRLRGQANVALNNLSIYVRLYNRESVLVSGIDSLDFNQKWDISPDVPLDVTLSLGDLRLTPGNYSIGLSIREHVRMPYDHIQKAMSFEILALSHEEDDTIMGQKGLIIPNAEWTQRHLIEQK